MLHDTLEQDHMKWHPLSLTLDFVAEMDILTEFDILNQISEFSI